MVGRKRLVVGAMVVGTVGVSLFSLSRWMNSPAATNTARLAATEPQGVLGSESELQPFQTTYFVTQISTSLRSKTSTENARGPILGSYLWTAVKPTLDDQVAVTINKLGNGSLRELSAVQLRQKNPTMYTAATVEGVPSGAIVYKRTDTYETAVFWQHADRYASLVVSGQQQRAGELDQVLRTLLSNWSWK